MTIRRWRSTAARLLQPEAPLARSLLGSLLLCAIVVVMTLAGLAIVGTTFAIIFLINLVGVIGLGIFMGNSGVFSFGHAGFMAVGAYVSGILSMSPAARDAILTRFPDSLSSISVSFPLSGMIALGAVAALAVIFGLAISRLPLYAGGLATLGVLVIVNSTLVAADELTNGGQPLYGVAREVDWPFAMCVAIVAVVVARLYKGSRSGLRLRSSREDELAAQASGVNIAALRMQSWVLSAVVAGAAGVLLGHFLGAFSPNQFYLTLTVTLVAMLIVGGAGTVSGAIMGTALVTIPLEVLSRFESGASLGPIALPELFGLPTFGLALVLIVTVYFRRDGLFGRQEIDELIVRRLGRTKFKEEADVSLTQDGPASVPAAEAARRAAR